MKKILLFILLIAPLFVKIFLESDASLIEKVEEQGLVKKAKDYQWEFLKESLFLDGIDRGEVTPSKIQQCSMVFLLQNETLLDSLAMDSVVKKLKQVLPDKVILSLSKGAKQLNTLGKTNYKPFFVKFETGKGVYRGSYPEKRLFYFGFKKETSLKHRIKYIQYEIVKTLCGVYNHREVVPLVSMNYPLESILNDPVYNVLDKEFTELDKFVLKKLYADDFQEQFSDYMYKTYPWRYAGLFVNKEIQKLRIYICIGLVAVLILILSFSIFNATQKNYWYYFFTLLTVFVGILNLYWMHEYFIEIQKPISSLKNTIDIVLYLVGAAFVTSFFLWFMENIAQKLLLDFTRQFLAKLLLTIVAFNIPIWVGYFVIQNKTSGFIAFYGPLFYVFLALALGRSLLLYLNHYSQTIVNKKELELSKLRELNTRNELKSLHAHINPHFLYNALNSITGLIHENPNKAEEMVVSLSDLFRHSINRKNKKMSAVSDEVEMVENYLKIEKIRFGNRLEYNIHVEECLLAKEIPMYLLQPLVENAVKHGISKFKESGTVSLEVLQKDQYLQIVVKDSGALFPENLYGGYGLQSVYDLLRLSYGEKATLQWVNVPEKKVMILIPL